MGATTTPAGTSTGGTTGKSKGVLRDHSAVTEITNAVLSEFELPAVPSYLAVAPISHVAGTKVLPVLMRGGTVHLMQSFDPERVLDTIARERINFTLLVPTMVYVLLDHPKLPSTDLSSLELVLYGASPMAPARWARWGSRVRGSVMVVVTVVMSPSSRGPRRTAPRPATDDAGGAAPSCRLGP